MKVFDDFKVSHLVRWTIWASVCVKLISNFLVVMMMLTFGQHLVLYFYFLLGLHLPVQVCLFSNSGPVESMKVVDVLGFQM